MPPLIHLSTLIARVSVGGYHSKDSDWVSRNNQPPLYLTCHPKTDVWTEPSARMCCFIIICTGANIQSLFWDQCFFVNFSVPQQNNTWGKCLSEVHFFFIFNGLSPVRWAAGCKAVPTCPLRPVGVAIRLQKGGPQTSSHRHSNRNWTVWVKHEHISKHQNSIICPCWASVQKNLSCTHWIFPIYEHSREHGTNSWCSFRIELWKALLFITVVWVGGRIQYLNLQTNRNVCSCSSSFYFFFCLFLRCV